MEPYVRLEQVCKVFRTKDGRQIEALRDVDLEVGTGEFVALVGPSGCGKSTALSMLTGLAQPTSGRVTVEGRQLDGVNTELGMVFQKDVLLEWRSAVDNVLLQIQLRGRDPRPLRGRALELLDLVGMGDFADKLPRELSGGMRQRVAICRALVHDPPLLLMDEPFGALDAITREQLNHDLARVAAASGKTVLFVTHSIEEAVFLADRVLVMAAHPGQVTDEITVGPPRPRQDWTDEDSELAPSIARARRSLRRTGAAQPTDGRLRS